MTLTKVQVPTYGDYVFPNWAVGLGWLIALLSVIPIPAFAVIEMIKAKGSFMQVCAFFIR